jgi:hypothetical protein
MALEKNIKKIPLIRQSYYDVAEHLQDDIKNYGYDYENDLFEKSVSSYLMNSPLRAEIIHRFTILFAEMINRVKDIKRSNNFAMDKKFKKFN